MTEEKRMKLAEALQSDAWKEIDEAMEQSIKDGVEMCAKVTEDHRFWQGAVAGLRNFRQSLQHMAHPPETKKFSATSRIY